MSAETFSRGLRSAVRGLWMGVLDSWQFYKAFEAAIGREIALAWEEGAADGGVTPEEYSPEENAALSRFLVGQYEYITDFADTIMQRSRAKGGALQPLLDKVELWVNRYSEARNQARAMAMADQKMIWELGPTVKHCTSCLKVAGKVKRGSVWFDSGIMPQSRVLECGGWRCLCGLKPTKLPATPGPLPSMP